MELIRTRKMNYSLRVACRDGSVKTLHSLYDPEGEARAQVDAFAFDGGGILVVLGLGLGYHVSELRRRHPDADIVVVEGVPEIRELALEHGTIPSPGEGVVILSGLEPAAAIGEIRRRRIRAGFAPLAVFPLASAVSSFPEYYEPIREALSAKASPDPGDRLRYPKFRGDRRTVALFDFGYFLTGEAAGVIRGLGHEVVRVKGTKDDSCGDILGRATETIRESRPDFFLTINHFGFDEAGVLTDLFKAIEMPAASWFVDSPNLIVKAFGRNASPYTAVFTWDRRYVKDLESMGFEEVSCLPLATDESVFRPRALSAADRRRYGAGVGFVGNSMVEPVRDKLRNVRDSLHGLVEETARVAAASRCSVEEALEAALPDAAAAAAFGDLSPRERGDFEGAVLWRATLLYRLACVRMLSGFNPRIRGDEGWKTLVNGGFRLGPPLNYYGELPLFYNACAVNFNATSVQMGTSVNQRVFDVPACGSFLLTDHQESIEELFDAGKEVVTYRDREEIPGIAGFYLRNPGAREAVAMRARERVLREHTYRHRIERIVQVMKGRFG